ncbi:MAG: RlmE family RNA methyltransferase [Polyangiaceae bacterium]|nr:RlmE family RNA methyltransferase [Polyangiaceae bacterium]
MTSRRNLYQGDARTRQARAQGYPARSVFKLEEIDRRVRLFKSGQRVLDLGAMPGSWTLYACERVGPGGVVVAVDLKPITVSLPPQAIALVGDALALEDSVFAAHGPFDVVLSDMAPSTSGARERDQARSVELFLRAVAVAGAVGRPGSSFVGKLFMGPDFTAARRTVAASCRDCRVVRPEGTRQRSSEVFVIGLGFGA